MPAPLNLIVLTLLEATVTLYPQDRDGRPVLDSPLWHGVAVADLTVRDRWIKVETRPTGAAYPHQHNLSPQFEITLGRVWALPLAQLTGFNPARGAYVLDVVWKEEDTGHWHREVYYGVTISERTRAAKDRDGEFIEDQVFAAEYVAPPTSGQGLVDPLSATLPLTVRYVSASEDILLYTYDPTTKAFSEVAAGITTGRAALAYNPGDRSGEFTITFTGEPFPALRVTGSQELEVSALRQTAPGAADVPRVEFRQGDTPLASVTQVGAVYAAKFLGLSPVAGAAIELYGGGQLAATLATTGIAGNFSVFSPNSVAGLEIWVRAESLSEPVVTLWPDDSGHQNHLSPGGTSPELLTGDTEDEWTHRPVTNRQSVRLRADQVLRSSAVVPVDQHCLFAVILPFGPGAGVAHNQVIASGDSGADQFQLQLTDEQKPAANFSPLSGGSPVLNTVIGTALGSLHQPVGWRLFEQEASAPHWTPEITSLDLETGTLPAENFSYAIVDVMPTGLRSPSTVQSFDLAGAGGMFSLRVKLPAATPGATGRRIYRNKVSGGADLYLLTTVAAGATYYDDNASMAEFAATNPAALDAPGRVGFLTLRVNGVTQASAALSGLASAATQPLWLGAASGGLWGLVQAVLLYSLNPTAEEKFRLRRFLNRAYQIY